MASGEEERPPVWVRPTYKNASRITYFRDEVTGEKYYKCTVCSKKLKGHVSIHMRTHTGSKPWKCKVCKKSFSQKCNLQSHMEIHTADKRFKCELCPKGFDYKKNLERHISVHTGEKPYQCEFCQRRFASVDMLCKHKRLHTGETPYECVFCAKKFSQYSKMIWHYRRHIGETPYFCSLCDKSGFTSSDISSHLRRVHLKITTTKKQMPIYCPFCEQLYLSPSGFEYHSRKHTKEAPYFCQAANCGEEFSEKYLKIEHSYFHTGVFPFTCNVCSKRFLKKSHLDSHHKHDHKKSTPSKSRYQHSCSKCPLNFSTKYALKIHEYKCHHADPDSMKLHKCPICKKRYFTRNELRGHVNTHCDEKNYKCEQCGKRYKGKSSLHRHRLHNHTAKSKRPARCTFCNKTYSSACFLVEHMVVHTGETPYQCDVCLKRFSSKGKLRNHKKVVDNCGKAGGKKLNTRTVQCSVCSKGFLNRVILQSHLLEKHTGKECSFERT